MFFRDILGQERVLAFLRRALAQKQVPSALLFLGGEGVGKTSTARALAQALNCQAPLPDQDACGRCPACRLFAEGCYPDYWEILPLGEGLQPQIRIDQIRELRRRVGVTPVAGGWRVVLIKPAEALNEAAANAFLKTLEEPPLHNLLILTATGETDLLPTIVSRCRRLTFAPIPQEIILAELQRRRGLEPAPARLVAGFHAGSLGRALAADPEALMATREAMLTELAELEADSWTPSLDWAAQKAKHKEGLEQFLVMASIWYRDLLALAAGAKPEQIINQDRLAELKAQQQRRSRREILQRLEALNRLPRQLRANFNVELSLNFFSLFWRRETPGEAAV